MSRLQCGKKHITDCGNHANNWSQHVSVVQVAITETNKLADCSAEDRVLMMQSAAQKSLERFRLHEGIKEGVATAADVIGRLSTFVGGFLSAYPPAAMAVSGISAALPMLSKLLRESQAVADGLELIMGISDWYMGLCRLVFRRSWRDDQAFHRHSGVLKARVTALYSAILEFQIKCVCRCYRDRPVVRNLKIMLGSLDWKSEAELIRVRKENIKSDIQEFSDQLGIRLLQDLRDLLAKQLEETRDARELETSQKRRKYESQLAGRFMTTPEYSAQFKRNRREHVEGTCEWFCSQKKFLDWLDAAPGSVLLVSAHPGCGKSVLASYLADKVIPKRKPDAIVCYYFFKDNGEENKLCNAYSAFLHQLFSAHGALADHCKTKIENAGPDVKKHQHSLWSIFTTALECPEAGSVVCVLDALDECGEDGLRNLIDDLRTLHSLLRSEPSNTNVRFLLTMRQYPSVDRIVNLSHATRIQLSDDVEIRAFEKEVDLVVNHRLAGLARKRNLSAEAKKSIELGLRKQGRHQKTYLWTRLIFEVLERSEPLNDKEWEHLARTLPTSVHDAYTELLERVQPGQRADGLTLLHLVLAAYRPLTLSELNIALNVRKFNASELLDPESISGRLSDKDFYNWIIHTCGFLITEDSGKVHFIHQTAREFLLGTGDMGGETTPHKLAWAPKFENEDAHATMAESCVSYLSLQTCRTGAVRVALDSFAATLGGRGDENDNTTISDSSKASYNTWPAKPWLEIAAHPFAEYAIRFWPSHFRHSQRFTNGELSRDIDHTYWPLYVTLMDTSHPLLLVTARAQNVETLWAGPRVDLDYSNDDFTYDSCLLGFADELGILHVHGQRLEISGGVASLGALWGHVRVLRQMVDLSTQLTRWLSYFGILWLLAVLRDISLVSWLFQQLAGLQDPTLLFCAIVGRSIPCLDYLLLLGSRLHCRDRSGRLPMHLAADRLYGDIVEWLLDHGAAVDGLDRQGRTPLFAVLRPYALRVSAPNLQDVEDVAKLLVLGRNNTKADLTAKFDEIWGDSPLHLAASINWCPTWTLDRGRSCDGAQDTGLIALLIQSGAQVNTQNHVGKTPLMLACEKSALQNVSILLRNGANPNLTDTSGRSPLRYCIEDGHRVDVAKLLLKHGASQAISPRDGNTALHVVCMRVGSSQPLRMVEALLAHGADARALNADGRTPLNVAIWHNLGRGFEFSTNPSSWNLESIVVRLLNAGGQILVDVKEPISGMAGFDEVQWTPLHWASYRIATFLAQRLLEHGADVAARDSAGRTPLHVVLGGELLHGPLLQWRPGQVYNQPWVEKMVRMLLWHGAPVTARDNEGHTPADMAQGDWTWLERAAPGFLSGSSVALLRRPDLRLSADDYEPQTSQDLAPSSSTSESAADYESES
ncbi:hypothetical protein CONLIGDRAFT_436266 [Coniochaeta ligniaria NRRL 30616]|uniref:Uncharacterized protein n=1 Tax=Coniochaeta ligniaria NRRL 30616 TaxID=1408157 RepID=A0A1J7J2I7_9PEZI|nr:hypothetical protein CONLIGDRAFT_436266 [Coniochaeta ligniaria NRRL 30616]